METELIFYLRWFAPYKLSHLSYIDWAIKQLENGKNSEALYELAGLYKNSEYSNLEIERYFATCIRDIGVLEPATENETLINYSIFMCKTIKEKCNSIDSLEALIGELTSNVEDFNVEKLEPLLQLSGDLFNIKHNVRPEYYLEMNRENATVMAKVIATDFIEKNDLKV